MQFLKSETHTPHFQYFIRLKRSQFCLFHEQNLDFLVKKPEPDQKTDWIFKFSYPKTPNPIHCLADSSYLNIESWWNLLTPILGERNFFIQNEIRRYQMRNLHCPQLDSTFQSKKQMGAQFNIVLSGIQISIKNGDEGGGVNSIRHPVLAKLQFCMFTACYYRRL